MQPTDTLETQPLPTDSTSEQQVDSAAKKRWQEFRQRTDICKHYKKKLVRNWTTNIDYRRGKPFASQSDEDAIAVNLDWSLTKTKQASLFSQVPKIRVNHAPESITAGPWVAAFERELNDTLVTAGIEAAMDEVLPDCINAAGFGAVLVSCETLTEDREVPAVDLSILPPEIRQRVMETKMIMDQPLPMKVVPVPVDRRYLIRRISPSDFLWPVEFSGSDFDNAPWLGHTGRVTWAEAQSRFGLKDEEKEKLLGDDKTIEDRLSHDWDREHMADDDRVGFDEIFYNEHHYDTNSKSFNVIHHLVFVHGKTEPVIDEPWKGQRNEKGQIIGAMKKPIRVLTLTYVTDEDIPPSDSAIGRAQVNEINKGRTQINRQRERAINTDWFDVNRLDPAIQQALMRGTWQRAIPVQGNGDKVIGTVAKSAMHQENFLFDRTAKADLHEQWTVGSNQLGVGGDVETKGEASVIQSNFMTKVGRERAKVGAFVVGISQVLGGLICITEDPQKFGKDFDPAFSHSLGYSILADSTVLVDAGQRLERLNSFVDMYGKSGWVNLEPVLKEIATLVGLDPNTVITPPKPAPPETPNISLRMTGSEDMMNPLLLAFMIKAGQAPDPELIEKAKTLIQQSVVMPQPPVQPGMPPPPGGPAPAPPPGSPLPPPPPPPVGGANPEMSLMPNIGKRAEEPK